MSDYKRWFQLQSNNYMKSLDEIKDLKEENDMLKDVITDIGFELSDEQLEHVIGGMSETKWKTYMVDLINEFKYLTFKS